MNMKRSFTRLMMIGKHAEHRPRHQARARAEQTGDAEALLAGLAHHLNPRPHREDQEQGLAQSEAARIGGVLRQPGDDPALVEEVEDADQGSENPGCAEGNAGDYGVAERSALLLAFPVARCDDVECHGDYLRRAASRAARRGFPAGGR